MKTVYTPEKMARDAEMANVFRIKQSLPYEAKIRHAEIRAREFYNEMDGNVHVSVGGLDSITLLLFLRSIGINCPAVSASSLEDKSIIKVHKALGVINVPPIRPKAKVLAEFGYPVLSKETANKIHLLQNPSDKNRTVRHAIITGETGEYGGNRTGTRMKMSGKWLGRFGGADEEGRAHGYAAAPFKVSDKCCYYLKEKPCDDWAKEHRSSPYLGLMASEHGRREKVLMQTGCNYYGKTHARSCPFAIFNRDDILRLALEMNEWYQEHWQEFGHERIESTIPAIYGEIVIDGEGHYRTTEAQRTGCTMCGFGIHLEKRPHRFDRLFERNPKEWAFWMKTMRWGEVLDYIGVGWRCEGDDQWLDDAKEPEAINRAWY